MPTSSPSDEELDGTMGVISNPRNDRCHTGCVKAGLRDQTRQAPVKNLGIVAPFLFHSRHSPFNTYTQMPTLTKTLQMPIHLLGGYVAFFSCTAKD